MSSRARPRLIALVLALAAAGCFTGRNYLDPSGPRYGGPIPPPVAAPVADHVLQVATFNIEGGEEIGRALDVIRGNPELRDADILLLQEMDATGTERIAETLEMGWVYYPATLRHGRGFGNAILTRWPIRDDEKLLLPHRSIFGGTRRIAAVATVRVEGADVRVYSVHLATPLNQKAGDRVDQLETILADAAAYPLVVIGGDLNSRSIAEHGLWDGFTWLTRAGPRTTWFARVDHILAKGFVPPASGVSGTIHDNRGASDHLPVWARVEIPTSIRLPGRAPSAIEVAFPLANHVSSRSGSDELATRTAAHDGRSTDRAAPGGPGTAARRAQEGHLGLTRGGRDQVAGGREDRGAG